MEIELRVSDLRDVMQKLRKAEFRKGNWEALGRELGLHQNTLDDINEDQGSVDKCFPKCLTKWLERADEVDERHGRPTFNSLCVALTEMGKKTEAERIRSMFEGNSSEGNSSEGNSSEGNSSEGKKPAKSTRQKTDSPATKTSAGNKDGGAKASASDEDTDGPDATQDPPQDKKYRKVEFSEDLVQDIEILLLPATIAEEKPVMEYLKQSPEGYIETDIESTVILYIGYYGKNKVIVSKIALDKSMQGPVHAAIVTTKIIERVKSIKHIVAVGVCFGKDPDKQELGEVIVSESIYDCVSVRQEADFKVRKRAAAYTVKPDAKAKFFFTQHEPQPENIKYTVGPIITTSDLIDNPEYKKNLLGLIPEAIAGEMEGAGIMAAISYIPQCGVSAIVIKGIGDWADGKKKATEDSKPIAARNAARYVYAALNK